MAFVWFFVDEEEELDSRPVSIRLSDKCLLACFDRGNDGGFVFFGEPNGWLGSWKDVKVATLFGCVCRMPNLLTSLSE